MTKQNKGFVLSFIEQWQNFLILAIIIPMIKMNVIVTERKSCHSAAVLWMPPQWQKTIKKLSFMEQSYGSCALIPEFLLCAFEFFTLHKKHEEGRRDKDWRWKNALKALGCIVLFSIKKGRSERSWGWESPLGVRVERRRDVKEQSPGDIQVSVSPI